MFTKTRLSAGLVLAFGSTLLIASLPASAQQRIEITGSSIKRTVADETALPVTILKIDELRASGVTTVEQAIQLVTASQSSTSSLNSIGSGTGGASYANLRAIGENKTLVLLNGRRIASFAFGANAVDLTSIPFAVIDRVEVLRDGASALYGTDAVGGVINFITKKAFKGGSLTLEASRPQEDGGSKNRISVVGGFGDLEVDGANFWVSFDTQRNKRIRALDREFSKTGIIPSRGVSGSSGTTFPGNFAQNVGLNGRAVSGNITAPNCAPPLSLVNPNNAQACIFDFSATIDIVPDTETETLAARGSWKVGQNHLVSLELLHTENENISRIAPDPVTGITVPITSPFFPRTFPNVDPTKPVSAGWRLVPAGGRTNKSNSDADRAVLDMSGILGSFDYRAGAFYTSNNASDGAVDGYVNAPFIRAQVAAGNLNPFGTATPAQLAIIEQAKRTGTFATANGSTKGVDFRISRDLFAMSGGNAAFAFGGEYRRETYRNDTDDAVVNAIPSAGRSPNHITGSRNVKALAAEVLLPVLKTLEVTLQARADDYSDAGFSFNPKIGLRFAPIKQVVVRASYNTGFRAPTLDELLSPQTTTFAASASNDPLLCPGGVANVAAGGIQSRDCGLQVQVQQGGNPALKPEESKTYSVGLALEPIPNLTFTVDYWNIKLTQTINALPADSIIADPVQYAAKYVRCRQLSTAVQANLNRCGGLDVNSNAIAYLITLTDNLGKTNTDGIDVTAGYNFNAGGAGNLALTYDGTWVHSYKYQLAPTDPLKQNVGIYSDGSPVFRWQHTAALRWNLGNFSSRLQVRHKTGYVDQNLPSTVVGGPSFYQSVNSYTLVDLSGTAKFFKGFSLTAGVRNLFDKDPPFSNQSSRQQRGYDPRYTEAYGRTYFGNVNYTF
ncbi:MAG: TonB-dependent receptor [Rubrivivax sp.]